MLNPARARLLECYTDWVNATCKSEVTAFLQKWPCKIPSEFHEIERLFLTLEERVVKDPALLGPPANEPAVAEVQRLRKLIEDTAKEWQRIEGIPFEGGIDAAMRAGVDEIVRLRAQVKQLESERNPLLTPRSPEPPDASGQPATGRHSFDEWNPSNAPQALEREPTVQADLFDVKFGKVSAPPPVGDQAAKFRSGNWTYEIATIGWGPDGLVRRDLPDRMFIRRSHQDGRTDLLTYVDPIQHDKSQQDEISKLKDELDLACAEVQKSQCTLASFRTAIQMLGGKIDQEGNVTVHYGSPPADVLGEKFHTALGKARQDDDVPASIYNAVKHLSDVVTGLLRRIPS